MKAYLVFVGDHEDYRCVGVHLDKEIADKHSAALGGNVEEHTIGEMPPEIRAGKSCWDITMDYNTGSPRGAFITEKVDDIGKFREWGTRTSYRSHPSGVTVWADSRADAMRQAEVLRLQHHKDNNYQVPTAEPEWGYLTEDDDDEE